MNPHRSIVILTGAGISRESGVPTFRDAGGIWATVNIEDVATPQGYARDPQKVQDFYNARRQQLPAVHPNAAHLALAELERQFPGDFLLITQNIDDLHERAGSRKLLHMHGELTKARCTACGRVIDCPGDLQADTCCPHARCEGFLRPHVVWFGEMPLNMGRIDEALQQCDLFAAIGTSGNVYPAAGFVAEAAAHGAYTVELNLEPTPGSRTFSRSIRGKATDTVPEFVREIIEKA
jgi:NAD-dependent deacetylase